MRHSFTIVMYIEILMQSKLIKTSINALLETTENSN